MTISSLSNSPVHWLGHQALKCLVLCVDNICHLTLQIWSCLAENAVYACDRDYCFRWFSKVRLNGVVYMCNWCRASVWSSCWRLSVTVLTVALYLLCEPNEVVWCSFLWGRSHVTSESEVHCVFTVLVWVSMIGETWTNSAKECTSLLSGNSTELYDCNTVRWTNQYYSPSVVLLVGS